MENEDLYRSDIRNYYNQPFNHIVLDGNKVCIKNATFDYPDGKANRRERRKAKLRRKKGRL